MQAIFLPVRRVPELPKRHTLAAMGRLYIREWAKRRGLTVAQLCERAEISESYFSRLASGQRASPSDRYLQRIAKALNVDVSDLYRDPYDLAAEIWHQSSFLSKEDQRRLLRMIEVLRDTGSKSSNKDNNTLG